MLEEKNIIEQLSTVEGFDPTLITTIRIKEHAIFIMMEVPAEKAQALEPIREQAEKALLDLSGIEKANILLTAQKKAKPQEPKQKEQEKPPVLPNVQNVIAVASGKGGVGKSTVAINLAISLAKQGLAVGLLDADIYGPSMPLMTGLENEKPGFVGGMIEPLTAFGMKIMSIGFLVDKDGPLVWRGALVHKALTQMLSDVNWGDLDVLVIDMPPGTGDAQLTLAQTANLSGTVIVSTPQDIALIDARKGLEMFNKVNVPILGLVENMSYFECPHCHERSEIFGHGGAKEEAEKLGCPFLGAIPLHASIRITGDAGKPVTASEPDSPYAQSFFEVGKKVKDALALKS